MDQAGFLKQTPLFSGFSDKEIASVEDETCAAGLAGLGGGLNVIWFDNFSVKEIH